MLARNEINVPLFLLIDPYCLRVADAAEFQPAATKAAAAAAAAAARPTHFRRGAARRAHRLILGAAVSAGRITRDEGCVKRAKRVIGTSGGGDCGGIAMHSPLHPREDGWMDGGSLPGNPRRERVPVSGCVT